MSKRKSISADQAVQNILQFVYEESDEEESDMEELYGDEDFLDENSIDEITVDRNSISDASSDEEILEAPTKRRKHRKKQLTYTRNVHSIDSALCEQNYDILPIPTKEKIIKGQLPADSTSKNKKDKKEILFSNIPQKTTGRQNACNIISNKPGVSPGFRETETERDAFELFFTNAMIEDIVTCTNKRINQTLEAICDEILETGKYPHVKVVDATDIYALIGLMYMRGLYGLNNHSINLLFSDKKGLPVFGATMSRMRYEFMMKHLCFDDFETRNERWKHDRFAAIRGLFEKCNEIFGAAVVPEDYISLDETLYPTRNQVNFKQYNPDKPAKYGILFKSLNCARYPYTHQTHAYSGKPTEAPDQFYIQGTANYIKFLVQRLSMHHSLIGRNITMDRLYTSFEIAEWLLDRKITMLGTMQANRVGIPPVIKETKDREILSIETYWEKNGSRNISSYVVKTSKGKKSVIVLSTLDPIRGVTKDDEKKKPASYKLYDFTKGGTDIVDQKMSFYSCKAKSRKWTLVVFAYLLDTIRVNSATIYALNQKIDPKKQKSFEHGYNLAEQLILPQIRRRNKNGLTSTVIRKIEIVTGEVNATNEDPEPNKPGRCKICLNSIKGSNYKTLKDKIGKVKGFCAKCKSHCCHKHSVQHCKNCS